MRMSLIASSIAVLLAIPLVANAADESRFNVVNLEASASQQVSNDLAHAVLFVELSDNDPSKLADKINQTILAAQKTLKQYPSVQSAGTGYSSYPLYNSKNQPQGWRSRGELRINSKDFTALSQLIAALQKPQSTGIALQLADIRYEVSEQSRKQVEDQLIGEGLKAFRERASLIQRGMSGSGWKAINLNVQTQTNSPPPRPMYRMAPAMMEAAAAPAPAPVDAGESRLFVTVNGSIQIGD
ncbi:SIMPL domain-containing protein [Chitinibacter tainanensis]|uniref:SIMPL domain-containing protein n=1 Tax=Chitinibacter tainanensis TaxID=230667 RepID=UPI0003F97A86|nr:SIMPL domain-containing protein [Chitinibacter tainanensis]